MRTQRSPTVLHVVGDSASAHGVIAHSSGQLSVLLVQTMSFPSHVPQPHQNGAHVPLSPLVSAARDAHRRAEGPHVGSLTR